VQHVTDKWFLKTIFLCESLQKNWRGLNAIRSDQSHSEYYALSSAWLSASTRQRADFSEQLHDLIGQGLWNSVVVILLWERGEDESWKLYGVTLDCAIQPDTAKKVLTMTRWRRNPRWWINPRTVCRIQTLPNNVVSVVQMKIIHDWITMIIWWFVLTDKPNNCDSPMSQFFVLFRLHSQDRTVGFYHEGRPVEKRQNHRRGRGNRRQK
jgi:hypothetical protein